MAKEMAKIIKQKNGDFSHYKTNHPRCFCHVIALILGAGLKELKLKKKFRSRREDQNIFLLLRPL
jgi:hypothetical protein